MRLRRKRGLQGAWEEHPAGPSKLGLSILPGQPKSVRELVYCYQSCMIPPGGSEEFFLLLILEELGGRKGKMFDKRGCQRALRKSTGPLREAEAQCELNTQPQWGPVCHPEAQLSGRLSLHCLQGRRETACPCDGCGGARQQRGKERKVWAWGSEKDAVKRGEKSLQDGNLKHGNRKGKAVTVWVLTGTRTRTGR